MKNEGKIICLLKKKKVPIVIVSFLKSLQHLMQQPPVEEVQE